MPNRNGRHFEDDETLQVVSLPKKRIVHGKLHAQCLAWVLMSRTMGEYRKLRHDAGERGDGGYINWFIDEGYVKVGLPRRNRQSN